MVDSADDVALCLADALLLEGVLEEADWDGERGLAESLKAGLSRWANKLLGTGCEEGLSYFTQKLGFTNALSEWSVEGKEGDQGGFALLCVNPVETAKVGARITQLNQWTRGAGWSVMDALCRGLGWTVSAATPGWAADWCEMWWESRDTSEPDAVLETEGIFSPKTFHKLCPKKACLTTWNEKAMALAAKRTLGLPRDDWRGAAVEISHQLHALLDEWRTETHAVERRPNEMWMYGPDHFPGVCVRWSEEDHIVQILDDVGEQMWQIDRTDAVWMCGFREASIASIREAACSLRYCLKILGLCDILLGLLDSGETLTEVFKVQAARERVRV